MGVAVGDSEDDRGRMRSGDCVCGISGHFAVSVRTESECSRVYFLTSDAILSPRLNNNQRRGKYLFLRGFRSAVWVRALLLGGDLLTV